MKKVWLAILVCLLLAGFALTAMAQTPMEVDVMADYGAAGDGVTNDRGAIQAAIDDVHQAGGGTVTLTAGKTFLSAGIILKSNVTLKFGDGAKLKQCTDINAYVKPVGDGYERYTPLYGRNFTDTSVKYNHTWYSNYPFIYAGAGTTNIKITGNGIIEMTPGGASDGSQTICICPIGLYRVSGYEISDVTIQNYCTYAIMPYTTSYGLMKNITIKDAVYGSGDGISMMNSQNIRITGCNITTNDDAVYIFSSYADPRAANWWSSDDPQPSKNIEIDHNKLTVTWLDTKAMGFILWGAGCPDQSKVEVSNVYIHDNEFNTMGIWNNHPYDSETRTVPMKNIRFENNVIADGVQSNFYTIPMSDVYGFDCMTSMHNADFETTGEAYWVPVGSAGAASDSVGQDGTWYGYINHAASGSELYQGLKLEGGKYYSFTAKTQTSGDIAQLFVRDQVSGKIIAFKEFVNTTWRNATLQFEIPTTGNYQVGIRSGDSAEGWARIDSASLRLSVKEGGENTIFTTQIPTDYDTELAKTYDLGTRFYATKAGTISKVRIYARQGTNSVHQVRIWDYASKTVIAGPYDWSVSTDAAGWVEFNLPEALHIDANKDYMVSVTNGVNDYYARGKDTVNNFAAAILNGDLVTYVGSGAYSTTVGNMPTSVNRNMNYFRDVVFTADAEQPEEKPEETTGEQTIFTNQLPNDYDPNKNAQYDLGTIFSAKTSGTITKVRIYAVAGTNSVHTIRIWDAEAGTVLAKYSDWAVNVSADGWISYELPQALEIEAGKQYMVSVTNGVKDYYPRGKTAPNNFDTPILNGDLVTYVGSGRWGKESDSTMPANINKNMCYFRDIVFVADQQEEEKPELAENEQTIFTTQIPNLYRNDSFYELGTLFNTDCDGVITKVRLYTGANESGIHTVRIWDYANQTVLAGPYEWDVSAGVIGWQYFELPTPLAIKANTDYVVAISNNATNKYYSRGDQGGNNALEAPLTNGNLHTYAKSGLYSKAAGAMPNGQTVLNYFRDIVFIANQVSSSALEEAYNAGKVLRQEDYTAETWKPFLKALNVARILLADEKATQEELDAAAKALTDAMAALVKVKVLTSPTITLSETSFTYDGTPKNPTVTVKDGDTLIPESEYSVAISNHIHAGTATVTVTDKEGGAYKVSGSTTFTITPAKVTVTAEDKSATVNGTMPEFTYTVEGLLGSDKLTTEPALTCQADLTATGTFAIVPSGADAGSDYEISYKNGTLTVVRITKAQLETLVAQAEALEEVRHTASTWAPLAQALEAAKAVLAQSNPGYSSIESAYAALSDAMNGLEQIRVVTATVELSESSFTYDGAAKNPTVTVKDGDTLIPESEYTVSITGNVNAGTATVTVTDKPGGEYQVSGAASFTISPAALTVTAEDQVMMIGGTVPKLTYKVEGLLGRDSLTAEPVLGCQATGAEAGTFEITVSGASVGGNYTVTHVSGRLTVKAADKTALGEQVEQMSKVKNEDYTHGSWAAFTDALEAATKVLDDPNTTPAQLTAASNALTKAFNGLKKVQVVEQPTVELSENSFIYDGTPKTPTVILKDGDTVIPESEYIVTYENNTQAGAATVTVTDREGGDYTVKPCAATFVIDKALVTVTAEDKSAVVNGARPGLTYRVEGLVGKDKLTAEPTVSCEADLTQAGTYTITITGAEAGSNYKVRMVSGTLTVKKTATPPTGDEALPVLMGLLAMVSLTAMVVLKKKYRG